MICIKLVIKLNVNLCIKPIAYEGWMIWVDRLLSIKAVIVSFQRLKAKAGLIDGLTVYVETIVQQKTEILVTFLCEINTQRKRFHLGVSDDNEFKV